MPPAAEESDTAEQVRALISRLGDGSMLVVGGDLRQIGDLEEAIATALLWTVGLVAVLGMGGGALLSHAFLRRVDAISRTAEAIIAGNLTRRVELRGTGDDLDRLARTLNRMLDRIGLLMRSLQQVSSDIAHDLRTPLTRMYQRLEDARTRARSGREYEAAIDAALAEADGLLATFAALLRIAQVEGASPRAGFTLVDLSAVAETVADAYRPDAEAAGQQLITAISPGITVNGDRELLTQALANLAENALRHTPAGTCIQVRLAGDSARVILSVEDNGPGVASADLPRLTDRFYRGERSRTTPGNGLGLSLVGAVAELHRARLRLEPLQPGLRVSLAFPVVGPAS
jgi:signal transduction histidine kinase